MLRSFLLMICCVVYANIQAQFFDFGYVSNLNPATQFDNYGTKPMCFTDSIIYYQRSGGIQALNLTTKTITYKWRNVYPASILRSDTGGGITFIKDGAKVVNYNSVNDSVSVLSLPSFSSPIQDIAHSETNIWALTEASLAINQNSVWQQYTLPQHFYATDLLTKDDSTSFITDRARIYKYQNGALDSITRFANYTFKGWDIDTGGFIWIMTAKKLFQVNNNGDTTSYSPPSSLISNSNETFFGIQVDDSDNIWIAGYANLYLFNQVSGWSVTRFDRIIENFCLDTLLSDKSKK